MNIALIVGIIVLSLLIVIIIGIYWEIYRIRKDLQRIYNPEN